MGTFVLILALLVFSLGIIYHYTTVIEGRSIQSKIVEVYLRISSYKFVPLTDGMIVKYIETMRAINNKAHKLPYRLRLQSALAQEITAGMPVFFLNGKGETPKKLILFLHGGSYMSPPVKEHWRFLDQVTIETGAAVIVPLYPKAPDHQYREAFEKVLSVYEDLLVKADPQNIIIMGDSAGGGLSLAICQLLLEKGLPQPGNIILLSPWLDITMNNPDNAKYEDVDPLLRSRALIRFGKQWAGDADLNNYMLSPINGTLHGLGEISLFVGTRELFLPDARKFKDMASKQGVNINYFEYKNMNHVFPIIPIPEGKKATKQIIDIINKNPVI